MPSNNCKAKLWTVTCFFTDILYALDPELRIEFLENQMNNTFQGMAACKHVESSDGTEKIVFVGARKHMFETSCRESVRGWFARCTETVRFKIEDFTDLA